MLIRTETRSARTARRAFRRRLLGLVLLTLWPFLLGSCTGKPSKDYRQAVARHLELVATYQYDCFARPEYQEVVESLSRVKERNRDYPDAQAMLRRYAEEKHRILAATALAEKETEAQAKVASATIKGYEAAAEFYRAHPAGSGRVHLRPDVTPEGEAGEVTAEGRAPSPSPDLGPGDYVIVAEASQKAGARATEPPGRSRQVTPTPTDTPFPPLPDLDPAAGRQRQMDASAGWKCYSSTYGAPGGQSDSRYKIRLGDTPVVKIAGVRIQTLADLRMGLRQGAASSRERDEVLTLLAPYSEESLAGSEARFNPMSFLLITSTAEGYVEIDFLNEYDRCYKTARYKDADRNPPGGPLSEPGKAQDFDLSFPDFAPYALSIRMARLPEGVMIALDCRTRRGRIELCRFLLPRTSGTMSQRQQLAER